MRILRCTITIISVVLLSACNTIEHRPETLAKSPLPVLPQQKVLPKLVWSNSQSGGVGKSDSKLRLATVGSEIVVADHRGKIFALEKKTGNVIWRIQNKNLISSGPTVGEQKVFVGSANQILAYHFANATPVWQAEVSGAVLAAPIIDKGVVFAHTMDGSVVALNAESGKQLWHYNVPVPSLMLRRSSSPVVAGDHVLVGFSNGKCVALHRMDGTPEWEREIATSKGRSEIQNMVDISADPIVKENIVYVVSYQGKIAALELETGTLVWEKELSSYSGLAVDKDKVVVCDASGVIWALQKKTGDVIWKQEGLTGRHLTAPVFFQDFVIVGDEDGHLHWLLQEDGNFEGRIMVDGKGIEATPIADGSRVYVLGRSGKVSACTLSNLPASISGE